VALLTAGLLLLGVTPVWAAGQVMDSVALPQEAVELADQELSIVEGEGWGPALILVGLILLSSLRSCSVSVDVNSDGNPEFEGEAEYGAPRWKPGK